MVYYSSFGRLTMDRSKYICVALITLKTAAQAQPAPAGSYHRYSWNSELEQQGGDIQNSRHTTAGERAAAAVLAMK
jgi:hypothetical protein